MHKVSPLIDIGRAMYKHRETETERERERERERRGEEITVQLIRPTTWILSQNNDAILASSDILLKLTH